MFNTQPITRWLEKREMELLETLTFTDQNGVVWTAPEGSIVDGSSIPRVLWTVLGSPFVGKHRRASIVHDVYCKTKSMPCDLVHKMYFDACRADGVSYVKAKLFYYGIKIGGPKW